MPEIPLLTGFSKDKVEGAGLLIGDDGILYNQDADGNRIALQDGLARTIVMLALEGGDHIVRGSGVESVLFSVKIPAELMDQNDKARLEFIASNEGAGDVTYRAYFAPAGTPLGDPATFQVGGDTVIAAGVQQRCSVEVQNRDSVLVQSAPNLPMNTPDAAATSTLDAAVNTYEDCELFLTAQCADDTNGVGNAKEIAAIYIDPPSKRRPPWAMIFNKPTSNKHHLVFAPTTLFGGKTGMKEGDWARISYSDGKGNDRKLSAPFQLGGITILKFNYKAGFWERFWADKYGVSEGTPLADWVQTQEDWVKGMFENKLPGFGQIKPAFGGGIDSGYDDPDVSAGEKSFIEGELSGDQPQYFRGTGDDAANGIGEFGEAEGPWGALALPIVLGLSAIIPWQGKSDPNAWPSHPDLHCRIRHRALTWLPHRSGDKRNPGGGLLRVRVMWQSFPGWSHVLGDPNFDSVYRQQNPGLVPKVTFEMGDYSADFTPDANTIKKFRRPDNSSFGLSTLVFDCIFNLKYLGPPFKAQHAHVKAGTHFVFNEPLVGQGNNPIIAGASDTWTSRKELANYAVDENGKGGPWNLVKGGWYEYYPPLKQMPIQQM